MLAGKRPLDPHGGMGALPEAGMTFALLPPLRRGAPHYRGGTAFDRA
ncbi:hypothetical protein MASR1M66_01610 [Aminivibrio sp.]